MASQPFLPYGRQSIGDEDIAAVAASLKDDYLTTGPMVDAYERDFGAAVGAIHAVACNSGTAALHLAAMALDLKAGQAAIVPTITFLATANAVRMTGAEVVFADVDPDTGLLTPELLTEAMSRTRASGLDARAVLPVHVGGHVCDMPSLADVAAKEKLEVVEDACHSLGVEDAGACRHSAIACFSTHPVKAIATGEGGVVTTGRDDFARRMRLLRSHGMLRQADDLSNTELAFENGAVNPWYYEMSEIGWNYRLPDVLCALGRSQLKKLPAFFARRRAIAARYDRLLAFLSPAIRPVPHGNRPHGWHLYGILVDFAALGTTRARFMTALRDSGIGSQVHYIPVHRQPYYANRYGAQKLPGADAYYGRCLSIPMFPAMADADVDRVVGALSKLVVGRGPN